MRLTFRATRRRVCLCLAPTALEKTVCLANWRHTIYGSGNLFCWDQQNAKAYAMSVAWPSRGRVFLMIKAVYPWRLAGVGLALRMIHRRRLVAVKRRGFMMIPVARPATICCVDRM